MKSSSQTRYTAAHLKRAFMAFVVILVTFLWGCTAQTTIKPNVSRSPIHPSVTTKQTTATMTPRPTPRDGYYVYATQDKSGVVLRASADDASKQVCKLKPLQQVKVLDGLKQEEFDASSWLRVKTADGIVGYCIVNQILFATSNELKEEPLSKVWNGDFKAKSDSEFITGSLSLTYLGQDKVSFYMDASDGAHEGEVSGIGSLKGNLLTWTGTDKFKLNIEYNKDKSFDVSEDLFDGINPYAGIGVYFGGTYINPLTAGPTPTPDPYPFFHAGVFYTAKQDVAFKKLVGNEVYQDTLDNMMMFDDIKNQEKYEAMISCFYVLGIGDRYTIMVTPDGKMWLLTPWYSAEDNSKEGLYTNRPDLPIPQSLFGSADDNP